MDVERTEQGELVFHFPSTLDYSVVGNLWRQAVKSLKSRQTSRLALDLRQVEMMDTAGVALLERLKQYCSEHDIELTEEGIQPSVKPFVEFMRKHAQIGKAEAQERRLRFVEHLGERAASYLTEMKHFVSFVGRFMVVACKHLLLPHRIHYRKIIYQVQVIGVGAVPLLVSLSLLLGALMVFQGMGSVQKFGSDIYIADMVVISVAREMAPLLTAVVLSGRTGAAFAAELGAMRINDEIDALAVMDFDVVSFLVVPRVFAIMIAEPLLTMISDASGILGGLLTSRITLDLPFIKFLAEAQKTLGTGEIYSGLIKAVAFGSFIGLVGCFRGLQADMGASSVGVQTTSAVVTCIFLVIFFDTVFSYIFQLYGW